MKTFRSLLVSLFTLAAVACGETPADPAQVMPLAVVNGTISNPDSLSVQGTLRTAIVWYNLDSQKTQVYAVAQGVEVTPQFPAGFTLSLSDPPPAAAMTMLDYSEDKESAPVRGAFGQLVAYEDRNGNGQLDVVKRGDGAYIDRIVGSVDGKGFSDDTTAIVVWFDTQDVAAAAQYMASTDGSKPSAGYNVFRIGFNEDPNLNNTTSWVSAEQPLQLVLRSDAEVQRLMCNDNLDEELVSEDVLPDDESQIPTGPGPDGVWPASDDPHLGCQVTATGQVYGYYQCAITKEEVCHTVKSCTYTYWRKPADPEAAAGWPCP